MVSLLSIVGVRQANAYTVSDLVSDGWTQVTDATITGIADNYYILVDANSSAYVMSAEADHYRPCYKTINNPVENPSFVWILEGSDNTFKLKSASTGAYFKQSSGWNTSVGDGRNGSIASLQFTLSEGKYSIQCVGQGLVGHWNDNGAAVANDGENIAANKAAKDAPGFYLYSISKATYNAALVAARATGVSSATKASPADVTSYIQNANWSGDWGAWEFTCTSSGNIQWGQQTFESWNASNVVVKQVLTGVPNGLYKLTADIISGPGAAKAAYVFATGDEKVSSAVVSAEATGNTYTIMSNEVAGNTLTADNVSVSGNSLTVGIDQTAGWIVADNFKLYYYGPTVAGNAIALPDGGAMVAGQWYYFDVETAADDFSATAETLGDIICTDDGTQLTASATGNVALTATNNSFAVTRYYVKSSSANNLVVEGSVPSAAEKAALADAIAAAEAKIIGFENGEYAPYNNIDAMAKLAAAKAVNPETAIKATVVAATTTLTGATWTANDGEVNAIYWKTDYTAGDKATDGYVHPIGWTNTGYNTRIMCAANDATANPAMTTIGTAVFSKYNTTYGETAGYTLPLKAGKIYKITFKYCGWGNNPTTNIVLTDPESNAISLAPGFKPATNDGNSNAEHWYDYTGYFVSTTAGNYVLAMNKVDAGQQQIAWADMELVSASELEFADGSVPTYAPGTYPSVKITRTLTADKWASAIYPFAVSATGLSVATLTDFAGGKLVFTTGTSEANKPFLMKSASNLTEISLSDVAVVAASAIDVTEGDVTFTGKYAVAELDNSAVNYVLSGNTLQKVGTTGATINPYRAYFTVAESSSVKALSFVVDGTATGIDSVEATEAVAEEGTLYNTAGQQVTAGYKGIVIKNGKKYYQK